MSTVSLYVPCYNGAAWLAEVVEALLAQSRPADEVLVVDDGSTDDSAAIARSYGTRVQLVAHPRNLGLAVARNTALGACAGEIVAAVDADVRAAPTWLSRLLEGFTSPRVAAVGGRLVEQNQSTLPDRWRAAHMAQHAGDFPLRNPPVLPGANVAVRRHLVRALGGYEESFRTNYEDADLQTRLLARGYLCGYQPGALAYHLRRDSAQSVLRTYWGWLRPPFERQGAYRSASGLAQKDSASAGFARRALWQDLSGGDPGVAYLSLLILLAFPAADRAHAARMAAQSGDAAGATRFAAGARAWPALAPLALRDRSPALAARVRGDLAYLSWWGPSLGGIAEDSPEDDPGPLLSDVRRAVERLPRAWWPALEASRQRLAGAEGWPLGPPTLPPRPESPALAALSRASGRVLDGAGPDVQALILHGAAGRGEDIPWAPLELLLVLRRPFSPRQRDRLTQELARELGTRAGPTGAGEGASAGTAPATQVETVEGHRLGWMAPCLLQQSLLAGAVVLWGDGAVLGAIPSWPPERLDPRLALSEASGAACDLGAGWARLAVSRAAGALLLIRRAYSPWHTGRAAAVRRLWPEASLPPDSTAERFVSLAGDLVTRWLFAWNGAPLPPSALVRFQSLHAARDDIRPLRRALAVDGGGPPQGALRADVAVVVPTYRRPQALERTLRALLSERPLVPLEVVVSDDGSPEPERAQVAAIVERLDGEQASATSAGDSPVQIRLVRQENAGPAAARNHGARATSAPLLVFLDDDCAPAPDFLASHLAAHTAGAKVAVLGHVKWASEVPLTPFMELVVRGAQFNFGAIADPEQVPFTSFYTANCSLRRADLAAAGWFDASLPPYMEDTEFAYRLQGTGVRIVYRPRALVHHEHAVELAPYLTRQRRAGRAAVRVVERHPELFDVVGVGDVADVALREQFYTALLRYAFVVGVEEGLTDQVQDGRLTGAELESRFERWIAGWAVRQAAEVRAWRERAEALQRAVAERDERLAQVVQTKDAEIARLEGQLARINRLPPVRALHALQRRLPRMGHNTPSEAG